MSFLSKQKKNLDKKDITNGKSSPPAYWVSTGNYAQNKVISGSFLNGIPQARVTCFCGPAGSGKSFNVVNLMRETQLAGGIVIAVDTENALDDGFVEKLGVDTDEENYLPISVNTIGECKKAVSSIVTDYKNEYSPADGPDAPKISIFIDSLSMLMTDTEQEQFKKGENKGDQGQRNKQLKAMLSSFTNNIKNTNITMVVTSHVYKNQDLLNGEGLYIVPDAIKYACSQIVLVSKLTLKNKETKEITGIRMKCYGYKTRFTRPFQSVTIEVPYEAGMDPYNGLLDIAEDIGVVKKVSAWYTLESSGEKFQRKNFHTVQEEVLKQCEEKSGISLEAIIGEDEEEEVVENKFSSKKLRQDKAVGE